MDGTSEITTEIKDGFEIYFNNPYLLPNQGSELSPHGVEEEIFAQDTQLNNVAYNYDFKLEITSSLMHSITLDALRPMIDSQLKVLPEYQSLPYHFKRNGLISTPQLKDESKTLSELNIGDQSILHLQVK